MFSYHEVAFLVVVGIGRNFMIDHRLNQMTDDRSIIEYELTDQKILSGVSKSLHQCILLINATLS